MTDDTDLILQHLAGATSRAPIDSEALREATQLTRAELRAGLVKLLDQRRIYTARLIQGDSDRQVYWPTGIVMPVATTSNWRAQAAAGRKPPTPITPPEAQASPTPRKLTMKPPKPTQGDALAKFVETDGPITASALADKGRVSAARNVATMLKPHIASGCIVTRYGYEESCGRELKHFMTPAQAEVWDAKAQQAENGAEASNAEATTGEIPAFLLKRQPDEHDEAATFVFSDCHINARGRLHLTLGDGSVVALPPADTARLGRFLVATEGVWRV